MLNAFVFLLLLMLTSGGAFAGEKAEIYPQLGHSSSVAAVIFSPDDHTLISAAGGAIKIWDVASGREIRTLQSHSEYINSIAISPDGSTVASASNDGLVTLWDVASGRELKSFRGVELRDVNSVVFTSDGRTLVSGDEYESISVWDVATGQEIKKIGHERSVKSVSLSPDGLTIASAGDDGSLKLWDFASGREIKTLIGHKEEVRSVAFSPDGRTLVSGSKDKKIIIWNVASGRAIKTISVGETEVNSVAFSPDGLAIASASQCLQCSAGQDVVTLWDVNSGGVIKRLIKNSLSSTSVTFSNDGRTLASGGYKQIKLWDIVGGNEIKTLEANTIDYKDIVLFADGRTLALNAGHGGNIKFWDLLVGRELRSMRYTGVESAIAFSPDGHIAVTTDFDLANNSDVVKLFDVVSGRVTKTMRGDYADHLTVESLVFSPDGVTVASGDSDYTIRLWDVASGRETKVLKGHTGSIQSMSFSPDGHSLASASSSEAVLWDVTSGRVLKHLSGKASNAVTFSPDGKTVSWYNGNGVVINRLDISSGHHLEPLRGHGSTVNSIAFSPNGLTMASASSDSTVKLWDVASGRETNTLRGHFGRVNSVRFTPDGHHLISAGSDSTARLWDVSTGKELVSFMNFNQGEWLAITPEGYYSSSAKGSDNLNVRTGNTVRGINQFYDVFYRPDIVEAKLRGDNISNLITLTIDDALKNPPPEVSFTKVPSKSSSAREKVCYKITSTGGGIGEVRLFQNGKLVKSDGFYREAVAKHEDKMILASSNGEAAYRSLRALKLVKEESPIQIQNNKGDVVEECQEIDAIPGNNELGVVAFNASNTIQSSMGNGQFTSMRKSEAPNLYILGIGIDKFADSSVNLKYASKDAVDFQALMKEKSGALFDKKNIHLVSLSNAEARKQNILLQIDELSSKIKPWDSFILFVASHGTMIGAQYYLVSSSFDGTSDMSNLIGSNEIVELSKKIRALNQLYIFDTCHAGGVDNIVSGLYDARMSVLAKKMGLHIYASAGGLQEALDGYKGNGLFTHTLLASMKEAQKNDTNHDGKVSVIELGKSAQEKTNIISTKIGHPQTPTMIHFGRDVPLFVTK